MIEYWPPLRRYFTGRRDFCNSRLRLGRSR
jgi:hypothetical protein